MIGQLDGATTPERTDWDPNQILIRFRRTAGYNRMLSMFSRFWLRPPSPLLLSFLAVTVFPASALFWLGWHFIEQDRALAAQRLRERREQAADLVVVALQQAVAAAQQRLDQPIPDSGQGAVAVVFDGDRIRSTPRLLYYPVVPSEQEPPMQIFARGEELEFKKQDYDGAVAAFRELAASPDPTVRAGAHLRIARNLRKAGKLDPALAEYRKLARCGPVPIDGIPADLVARRARFSLLQELGRKSDAQQEAAAIASDLNAGRWQLTRAAFLHYAEAAGYSPTAEAQAFAHAAEWLWSKRKLASSGQDTVSFAGHELTLLWRENHALLAGSRYVEQHWLAPLAPLRKSQAVQVALHRFMTPGAIVRERSATGLPWAITISSAEPDAEAKDSVSRRQFLWTAFGLLAAILAAASYTIIRAVHRELAAARLQSDFVAAVSHEFRTPLTLLRQITESFTENRITDEAQREAYYRAQGRATERLHRLVESLLDFRRMEAGAKPYRLQPLDPALLVQKVVTDFQTEAACNGYGVELSIHEGLPEVNADSDALTHAVWNLLDNAVKYSPDQRAIWVDVERQGEAIAIAVRDKGLGIPVGEQKTVFRKFVRGAAARLHEIKGTGIGLALVRNIVQAHGGKVLLESAPGVGSTFTIVLPAGKRVCPES